jgi:hypothetical protein
MHFQSLYLSPLLQHVIDNLPQFGIFCHHASTPFGDDIQTILQLHYVVTTVTDCFLVRALGNFIISYQCDFFVDLMLSASECGGRSTEVQDSRKQKGKEVEE